MKRKLLVVIATMVIISFSLQLQGAPKLSLRVTGKWTLRIDETYLTALAGSDFPGSFESAVAEVNLDITKTKGDTSPWVLYVSKADTNWSSNVKVYVRRTSDGSGAGTITGGTFYQLLTNSETLFFTGTGDRKDIELQFRLDFSIADVNVADYVTSVNYTVIE